MTSDALVYGAEWGIPVLHRIFLGTILGDTVQT